MVTRADWGCKPNNSYGNFSEPGEDFTDTLVYVTLNERHTAKIYLKSKKTGRHYCMFLCDFTDLLRLKSFNNNEVTGTFRFTKKGQSQGIKLVMSAHDKHELEQLDKADSKEERLRWI